MLTQSSFVFVHFISCLKNISLFSLELTCFKKDICCWRIFFVLIHFDFLFEKRSSYHVTRVEKSWVSKCINVKVIDSHAMTCVIAFATRILSNLTTTRHIDKSPGEACGEHTRRSFLTAKPIYLCLIFVYLSNIVKFISRYRTTLFSAKKLINQFHT